MFKCLQSFIMIISCCITAKSSPTKHKVAENQDNVTKHFKNNSVSVGKDQPREEGNRYFIAELVHDSPWPIHMTISVKHNIIHN